MTLFLLTLITTCHFNNCKKICVPNYNLLIESENILSSLYLSQSVI